MRASEVVTLPSLRALSQPSTVRYINHSHVLIVLRGASNRSLAWVATRVCDAYRGNCRVVRRCSFPQSESGEQQLVGAVRALCVQMVATIVVVGSHLRESQWRSYQSISVALGYIMVLMEVSDSHYSASVKPRYKSKLLTPPAPLYFAWQINLADSQYLLTLCSRLMKVHSCCQHSEHSVALEAGVAPRLLHCTAAYLAASPAACHRYRKRAPVADALGSRHCLLIIGLLATHPTLSLIVSPTIQQLPLLLESTDDSSARLQFPDAVRSCGVRSSSSSTHSESAFHTELCFPQSLEPNQDGSLPASTEGPWIFKDSHLFTFLNDLGYIDDSDGCGFTDIGGWSTLHLDSPAPEETFPAHRIHITLNCRPGVDPVVASTDHLLLDSVFSDSSTSVHKSSVISEDGFVTVYRISQSDTFFRFKYCLKVSSLFVANF